MNTLIFYQELSDKNVYFIEKKKTYPKQYQKEKIHFKDALLEISVSSKAKHFPK